MMLRHYTWAELARRPGRTALTLAGIVIGVAGLITVDATTAVTRGVYENMFDSLTGKAELEVVEEGGGGFDPALAAEIEKLPGIAAAVPTIQNSAGIRGKNGNIPALALGVDPKLDSRAREYVLRAGRMLERENDLLLEAEFARQQGFALGQRARVNGVKGSIELEVAGLLEPRGAAAIGGGMVLIMPLAAAQRLYAMEGEITSLQIVLAEGADADEAKGRIAAMLPEGLTAQAPAARGVLAQQTQLSTEQGLATISVVSVVAGAFVILNTFLMNLGERRRQLAILRALGVTRRQLARLLLREALLLGIAGGLAGAALGLAGSLGLRRAMEEMLGLELPAFRVTARPFVFALVMGPGMALASCWGPARRAGEEPPLDGLLGRAAEDRGRGARTQLRAGAAILAFHAALLPVLFSGKLPESFITPMMPLWMGGFLIGMVLIVPVWLGPVSRVVGAAAERALGIEARLAFRRLVRRPTRTALTAGVLFVAMTVAIGMGNALLTNIEDISRWYESNVRMDYFVRAAMPDSGMAMMGVLPEAWAEDAERIEGVAHAGLFGVIPARAGDVRFLVLAKEEDPGGPVPIELQEGESQGLRERLRAGEAVLATVLAHQLDAGPGDRIMIATKNGPREVAIAGTTLDYTLGGQCLVMDWHAAKALLGFEGAQALLIRTARPGDRAAGEALRKFCDERELLLQSSQELQSLLDQMIGGVVGSLYLLMALVFVVASLGIVNTLTMNVLEQSREIGVLRAIAMRRREVRRMVFFQALGIGCVTVLPGAAGGMLLAWLMNLTSGLVLAKPMPFQPQLWFLAFCCAAAVGVALAAAIGPARRAAGLPIIQALHYE